MPPAVHHAAAAADAGRILTAWAVQQVAAVQPDPHTQQAAAVALRELASAGRSSIVDIFAAGAIPALAALLSSESAAPATKAAALVALRRLASRPALFGGVAAAVSISTCLQLLRSGGGSSAVHAAAAGVLNSLAANSRRYRQQAVAEGAAPLLVQHAVTGSMEDGVWQPSDPPPVAFEYVAARALHTLHPGAPDTGLWHAGIVQTICQLDSSAAEDVQRQAAQAVLRLAGPHIPELAAQADIDDERLDRIAYLDSARSLKLLLLLRAGAVPRLVSLVRDSPHPLARNAALRALEWFVLPPCGLEARIVAELIAAGALPVLLQVVEHGSQQTDEQRTAVSALVELAEHSKAHRALLISRLVPILVDWLCDPELFFPYLSFASAKLSSLILTSTAACQAAVDMGMIAALQPHRGVAGVAMLLDLIEEFLLGQVPHTVLP